MFFLFGEYSRRIFQKKTMKFFIVFFCVCVVFLLDPAKGLRCYTCSYDNNDKDSNFLCVTAPWNLTGNPIRTCLQHVKFCIIVRIESKETGKVTSFLRKCEENPTEDSDVDSSTVAAHFRSCTTDLCNKGDGLDFIDEGHEDESVAILVPDKNSSGFTMPCVLLFVVGAVISSGLIT